METTTIHTLVFKGQHFPISDTEAAKYQPENIKAWEFQHEAYTAGKAIEVGKRMNSAGLVNMNGIGDAEALSIARGQFIAQVLVKDWNRTIDDGSALPVTPENIAALPPVVVREFGKVIERGIFPTPDELAALKLPTTTSASTM